MTASPASTPSTPSTPTPVTPSTPATPSAPSPPSTPTAARQPLGRRAARAALIRAVRGRGQRGGQFGEALIGEFEAIGTTRDALWWAARSLPFAWRERRRHAAGVQRAAAARPARIRLARRVAVPVLGLAIAVPLLNWQVASVSYIPSASMAPSYRVGDRALVDKLGFRVTGIHHGDVVLVAYGPAGGLAGETLVKRVIGLPGDSIACRDGRVYRNGAALAESYAAASPTRCDAVTVPPGRLYLLGDDRDVSMDSRQLGSLPESDVVGRLVGVIWPPSR